MQIPLIPVVLSILQIFGMFGIGILTRYFKYFTDEDLNKMSRFTVDCLMPFLIFHAIVTSFKHNQTSNLLLMPVIGFLIIAIGAVAGILLKKGLKSKDPDIIKTFHHFCAINNYRFLPIIIVQNVFGEARLADLFFLNLGSQIAYWTIGVALLGETDIKIAMKNLLTPSIIALFLAIIIGMSGMQTIIPLTIMNIFKTAGQAAIPLILILIGASLYQVKLQSHLRDLLYLTFVRLALIPFILIMVFKAIPMPDYIYNISLIIALMPVASSTAVLTRRFGGSPSFAAAAAVITHVFAIITVPAGLYLLG